MWKIDPIVPDGEYYYYFTDFVINLNHLNNDLLRMIPLTDTRLRPDQRALEEGLFDLAASEKHRLEEKQRARRKVYEKTN